MAIRLWQLAAELNRPAADVIATAGRHAPDATSHLSTVSDDIAAHIVRDLTTRPGSTPPPGSPGSPGPPGPPGPPGSGGPVAAASPGWTPRRQPPGRHQRLRRRPGPPPVTVERAWEPDPDDDDYYIDPTDELRHQPVLSTRDVATLLDVTPATIRKWVARGHLAPAGTSGASATFDTQTALAAAARIARRRQRRATPAPRAAAPAPSTNPGSDDPATLNGPNTINAPQTPASPGPRRPSTPELYRLARVHPHLVLTTTDAAALLGLAPATIRSWVHRGHLHPARGSSPHQHTYRLSDLIEVRSHPADQLAHPQPHAPRARPRTPPAHQAVNTEGGIRRHTTGTRPPTTDDTTPLAGWTPQPDFAYPSEAP